MTIGGLNAAQIDDGVLPFINDGFRVLTSAHTEVVLTLLLLAPIKRPNTSMVLKGGLKYVAHIRYHSSFINVYWGQGCIKGDS